MLLGSMLLKLCIAIAWLAAAGVTWQAIFRLRIYTEGGHYEGTGGDWWLAMLILLLQIFTSGYIFFVRF